MSAPAWREVYERARDAAMLAGPEAPGIEAGAAYLARQQRAHEAGLVAVAEAAVKRDWDDPDTANPWRLMACRNTHERNEAKRAGARWKRVAKIFWPSHRLRDAACYGLEVYADMAKRRLSRLERAEAEVATLREALTWYADARNWMRNNPLRGHPQGKGADQSEFIRMVPSHKHAEPVAYDQGQRAREALKAQTGANPDKA